MASSDSRPVASRPSPSRVTVVRRSSSVSVPPSTSATSRRVEFVPMSTTATLIRKLVHALDAAGPARRGRRARRPGAGAAGGGRPSARIGLVVADLAVAEAELGVDRLAGAEQGVRGHAAPCARARASSARRAGSTWKSTRSNSMPRSGAARRGRQVVQGASRRRSARPRGGPYL